MSRETDFYAQVAEKLIAQLKTGTAPWQKPWGNGGHAGFPKNLSSGNRYKGGNALTLMAEGYSDPRWLTYKQAAAMDAQVRSGEKGTPIIYWKFQEEQKVKDANGKPILDETGKAITQTVNLERPRVFLSHVFNAQQIDGLPELVKAPAQSWEPQERAEALLKNSGVKIEHLAQPKAYYSPAKDKITLPVKELFKDDIGYYDTALHELGHWTGHATRLNRDIQNPFGSAAYAKEELMAEISSMMLSSELGINHDCKNHAAYVQSWIKALQDDPKEIFKAAAEAEKIMDYILAFEHKLEQTMEETQNLSPEAAQTLTEPSLERMPLEQESPVVENSKPTVQQEEVKQSVVQEDLKQNAQLPAQKTNSNLENKNLQYLQVPFEDKDKAKELGAKWDRQERSWYVPATAEMQNFSQWLKPAETKEANQTPKPEPKQEPKKEPKQSRQYLDVPYLERNQAKSSGAKWDSIAKSWYVGENADMTKLDRYLPNNQSLSQQSLSQDPDMSPREAFAVVLRKMDCIVDGEHPIMDGKTHRIATVNDAPQDRSGFYVLHPDGKPAGYAKNNRSGEEFRWKYQGKESNPQEQGLKQKEYEASKNQRLASQVERHEQTAQQIMLECQKLPKAEQQTPYMAQKGIQVQALALVKGGTTCLPAQDAEGKIWTMQYIQEDGTKRFAKNGRKDGCFHPVGGMDAVLRAPALVISEGFATACSLTEKLGFNTIAAFDSGNLASVAKSLHAKYPDKAIIIAGDDDRHLATNPGRAKAEEAAKLTGGLAVFPIFASDEHGKGFSDFNDLAMKSKLGSEAIKRQVMPTIEKAISLKQEQKKQQDLTHKTGLSR